MVAIRDEKELDLIGLAAVLASDDKKDYAVPAKLMSSWFSGDNAEATRVSFPAGEWGQNLPLTDYATGQLHSRLAPGLKSFSEHLRTQKMHDTYQRTMRDVLDSSGATFRVRTLANSQLPERHARAVVSDRFKPIDDDIIFSTAMPLIDPVKFKGIGGNKTDIRTVAKFIERDPSIIVQSGVRKREFHLGFILGNSEVGMASASFSMFMSDSWCSNGCIFQSTQLATINYKHIGSKIDVRMGLIEGSAIEQAEMNGIKRLIETATMSAMSLTGREKIKQAIEASANAKIERRDMPKFFEEFGSAVGLTATEAQELPIYANSDEFTKLGMQAAITALAQDKTYERRLALETIGGNVLMMGDRSWSALASK